MATLAEILKSKISKNGKSKAYVASELGVTEKTIENYMNGVREPHGRKLVKLSQLLNFDLNDLSEQIVGNDGPEKEIPVFKTKVNPDTINEALAIIRQQNEFLQRMLDSNLAGLSRDVNNNASAIRAEIRGYGRYQILKESNWDDQEFAKAMAIVDRIYGEELKADGLQGNASS